MTLDMLRQQVSAQALRLLAARCADRVEMIGCESPEDEVALYELASWGLVIRRQQDGVPFWRPTASGRVMAREMEKAS